MSNKIRNFCIIAHIDHWKSTLADRMLEVTWTINKSDKSQVLDKMDLEQERWITIKLTPARMQWKWYEFNLIDTPWHVDFQYEVSRSLASVEWAILLVDCTQWIQAQTLSTLYMALDYGLEIIPVLNKIDLPAADPDRVASELENLVGVDKSEIIKVSAKTWQNVDLVLDTVIDKIHSWEDESNKVNYYANKDMIKYETDISRALIFDSVYDKYKWVVAYVKILDWEFKAWSKIRLIHSNADITPPEIGYFNPDYIKDKFLKKWQIWYIVTWQKSVRDAKIWDTMFQSKWRPDQVWISRPEDYKNFVIPWFKKVKPYVYAGVYPLDTEDFEKLRTAFEKLSLNDSAIEYDYENSLALWHGFRCGFLWTLHMDIIKERLFREYDVDTIFTIPNVIYLIKLKNKSLEKVKSWSNVMELVKSWMYKYILSIIWKNINNTEDMTDMKISEIYNDILSDWLLVRSWWEMPDPGYIDEVYEPYSEVEIVWPNDYSGNIMELAQEYRWEMMNMEYIDETRILWRYNMPMWEIIIDFYDRLKSSTKWYATMNYEFSKYKCSDLVRLDVFINYERVEAFSMVVHKDNAYHVWKEITVKLKEFIPRHMFPIPLQAWIWAKIIARETIPAMKKDVLAKCYWWDVTRKRKLLEKQKEGKKRMKQMWKVTVPNDIFIKMVSR